MFVSRDCPEICPSIRACEHNVTEINPYEFLPSPGLTVFIGFGARRICSQEFIQLGNTVDQPGKTSSSRFRVDVNVPNACGRDADQVWRRLGSGLLLQVKLSRGVEEAKKIITMEIGVRHVSLLAKN
jgi:hypothetical protein